PRAARDDLCPGLAQPLRICVRQPRDLLVLCGDQGCPVVLRLWNVPALAARVLECAADLAGVHQQLLRHTAADHTGAAPAIGLGDRDPRAVLGGHTCGPHAAGPTTDDEEVDVEP